MKNFVLLFATFFLTSSASARSFYRSVHEASLNYAHLGKAETSILKPQVIIDFSDDLAVCAMSFIVGTVENTYECSVMRHEDTYTRRGWVYIHYSIYLRQQTSMFVRGMIEASSRPELATAFAVVAENLFLEVIKFTHEQGKALVESYAQPKLIQLHSENPRESIHLNIPEAPLKKL